jgi:PD-(D/E)XK nuclease superfamily protein
MIYSYTQIAQYLRCPRSYRHRYLDGWREKDSRPALLFGRCFEQALFAFFAREDSTAVLFNEWSKYSEAQLEYSHGDSWERIFRQGVQLLERLAQEDRIQIHHSQKNMQVKLLRSLPNGSQFVAYVDAMGDLDSKPCFLGGQGKSGHAWSLQNRPYEMARDVVLIYLSCFLLIRQVCFGSPAPWSAFQDVPVVEQAVQHGCDCGAVAEQFAPVFHRAVGS